MTQALPLGSFNSSRLVRFFSDLQVTDVEVSHKNIADRLGQLIDLPDSIALADAHKNIARLKYKPSQTSSNAVMAEFTNVRKSIIQLIVTSFIPGEGPPWLSLPTTKVDVSVDDVVSFEAYQRFYTSHQREIDFKVRNLRLFVRESVEGTSVALAQLVALDAAMDDTLSLHARKLFSNVPKLLEKRFKYLLQVFQKEHLDYRNENPLAWLETGGWLDAFYTEMQGLLLAEVEVRLQPVLGLIEAFNEEKNRNL